MLFKILKLDNYQLINTHPLNNNIFDCLTVNNHHCANIRIMSSYYMGLDFSGITKSILLLINPERSKKNKSIELRQLIDNMPFPFVGL